MNLKNPNKGSFFYAIKEVLKMKLRPKRKNPLKEAAKRMAEAGWPTWKIAAQLNTSEATIVKWVRK